LLWQKLVPTHLFFVERGVRDVGYYVGNKFVLVPEMVPELVVPDLKDFEVSVRKKSSRHCNKENFIVKAVRFIQNTGRDSVRIYSRGFI
jgi:hypothetical protein